jgi:hypothetical protein
VLTLVWKYLKIILQTQTNSNKTIVIQHKPLEKSMIDQLRVIFQRNIKKLSHLYLKFFKDSINSSLNKAVHDNEIIIA